MNRQKRGALGVKTVQCGSRMFEKWTHVAPPTRVERRAKPASARSPCNGTIAKTRSLVNS
jgi:hypothetical protein